ncbi:ABC transporter permease [uncultured Bacteroides sp.]|uniref:ABC transporter permease n=1 Tax=uncultured Bacteroides sp. TaxID=162156 RepID=UPI002626577A|nr:ABC transporter permease [uncultured Bacteroides sp.]
MIKRYFKQSWELLKQNKLFSALYLAGTALAITMTMVIVIFWHIRTAPIYPETERSSLWLMYGITLSTPQSTRKGYVSHDALTQWFYPMKSAEIVSATNIYNFGEFDYIQLPNQNEQEWVKTKFIDPNFFKLFHFDFIDGRPFNDMEFQSKIPKVVISAGLAKEVFGTTFAVGKKISLNFAEYTVEGVVRDASQLTPLSYAQIYLPYTCHPSFEHEKKAYAGITTGSYQVFFKIKKKAEFQHEMQTLINSFNQMHKADSLSISMRGPMPYTDSLVFDPASESVNYQGEFLKWGVLILIFLLVPAMNLSGMISHRMESRMEEIGISRAFGATRGWLLRQILNENLILTILGGIIGLIITWITIFFFRNWIFGLFWNFESLDDNNAVLSPDMLFSPGLFLAAFLLCLVLNLLSGTWPAWKASRKTITYCLNQKK